MPSAGTIARTIARLTPMQIVARPYTRIAPIVATRLRARWAIDAGAIPRIQQWATRCVTPLERCAIDEARELLRGRATHCGVSVELQRLAFPVPNRLWAYEFHYRRWLLGLARLCRSGEITRDEFVAWWRDADQSNDPALREPYVLSRRIVSEALALGIAAERLGNEKEQLLGRVAAETALLRRLTEAHLAGNHELTRAATLAIADLLLCGGRTDALGRYSALLNAQCDEDGLHEERSPAYHLMVVADLQGVIAAAEIAGVEVRQLHDIDSNMNASMSDLLHPDGTLPMFHDSTAIVAPAAAEFGIRPGSATREFRESGLISWRGAIEGRDVHLVADFGSPRPSHQPGHQHAAPFAFELWWGKLLITSAGISTYDTNERRLFERGAAAHASVRLDGADPAEIWASFRMGRGYEVREGEVELGARFRATGVHDGFGAAQSHRRTIEMSGTNLHVNDVVEGHGNARVEVFLPIGPAWSVALQDDRIVCTSGDQRAVITASAPMSIGDFEVARQFGVRERAACAVLTQSGTLPISVDTHVDFRTV